MKFLTFLAMAAAAGCAVVTASPISLAAFQPGLRSYAADGGAPIHVLGDAQAIPGQYMVILKDGVSAMNFLAHQQLVINAIAASNAHAGRDQAKINHVYDLEGHLQGYAGSFPDDVLAYIRAHPEVAFVEQDSVVTTQVIDDDGSRIQEIPEASPKVKSVGAQNLEKGAPWGLVRVSHREKVGFGNFGQYLYEADAGEGVTAYVIDTGIYTNHTEFEGRARWGKTMPANDVDEDGNGHGTHCAGTIGSRKYGVAKKAELVAVKVLSSSGSGSMSDVTGGVLWAVSDAKRISQELRANPLSAKAKAHKGFVANMSLGGGKSPSLDKAVNGAWKSGIAFSVAAGNENADACNTSPAGAENPITVSASTIADERAYFSNWGSCTTVVAPGLAVLSTWNGPGLTNTISGTSMASPHVAGLASYYLSLAKTQNLFASESNINGGALLRIASNLGTDGFVFYALNAIERLLGIGKTSTVSAAQDKGGIVNAITPDDLKKLLVSLGTRGAISDVHGSPNVLIFNNATASLKN